MSEIRVNPPALDLPLDITAALLDAAADIIADRQRAFRHARRSSKGSTLRPGPQTPLWNALVAEIRPHLKKYGAQVNLGRVLGIPRQQVNAYFTLRTRMPDAERTLQLLAWLAAARRGATPA